MIALLALANPLEVHSAASPVGKVLSMLSDLQAKIIGEGEVVQKEYAEFAEWCEDRSRNVGFEIKTGKAEVEGLEAAIGQETASIGSLTTKAGELAASLASNDADLQAATGIRTKEAADFAAEEKELMADISTLERATGILEREMKGGASMTQLRNAGNLAQAFSVMLQASLISTGDATKLTALVQETHKAQDADTDEAPGAPAGAVYASQSGNVVDVLQDLLEKAESQLAETRKKETVSTNNYEMMKQSLGDEIKFAAQDKAGAEKDIAACSEKKSTAEGDLQVTSKELAEDIKAKASLHQECMAKASAFEAETNSRGEELKALASAKKLIAEATGGAALDQVSFVQVAAIASSRDLHRYEAVRLVRDLAHKEQSNALVQLASKMAAAMNSADAFAKVKGLISDMIATLEKEAGADATKKAYCDKELAESRAKKADKSSEIEGLSTKIEQMGAKSAQLKEEVAALENQLSGMAKSQAEMDKIRHEENAAFTEGKAVLEKGLTGIKEALKLLNAYYGTEGAAHGAADGAASGIIGLLEVVEADFSKNLAQITADEEAAVVEYEKGTNENEIEKTMKQQGVKYKTKESKSLDKTSGELTADRSGVQAELDAVLEYLSQIESECIAKAETYAVRVERRAAEIAGLKAALQILESETALVQRHVARRTLRGA